MTPLINKERESFVNQKVVPKEIPVVLYNGLNYDFQIIIKELADEFNGQFECLDENT